MPPLWGTTIEDFKIEPVKSIYNIGESVTLSGRLDVHKPWWVDHPRGRPIEIWSDMVKTAFSGRTGTGGIFKIVVVLPSEPGTYSYRAFFPGHGWITPEDPSWSNPIALSTEVPAPPVPPPPTPPPKIPFPKIPKYVLYASLGLLGIGALMWLARR